MLEVLKETAVPQLWVLGHKGRRNNNGRWNSRTRKAVDACRGVLCTAPLA